MKILVIEDTATHRKLLTGWLTRWGHEAFTAEDGLSGIEAFANCTPDLVLLDIAMPGIDGLETARRLRSRSTSWTPIIYISANDSPQDIGKAIEAGGDDYLVKPLNRIVLAAKLMAMERIVAMKSLMATPLPDYIDRELQKLTEIDSATGLANIHGLEHGLAREYARCVRTSQPISAIVAQVEVRLAQSGAANDPRWKKLSAVFKSPTGRSPDLVAHLGAGEFWIILPDTPLTGALHIANTIMRAHQEIATAPDGDARSVRLGIATQVPQSGLDHASLLEIARQALETAQRENKPFSTADTVPLRLTPRELECLQWCALGKSTWEIGQLLGISEAAVNFHMTNIRNKSGVSSRRLAVDKAIRLGLLRSP